MPRRAAQLDAVGTSNGQCPGVRICRPSGMRLYRTAGQGHVNYSDSGSTQAYLITVIDSSCPCCLGGECPQPSLHNAPIAVLARYQQRSHPLLRDAHVLLFTAATTEALNPAHLVHIAVQWAGLEQSLHQWPHVSLPCCPGSWLLQAPVLQQHQSIVTAL